jgi:hypothetical protein
MFNLLREFVSNLENFFKEYGDLFWRKYEILYLTNNENMHGISPFFNLPSTLA